MISLKVIDIFLAKLITIDVADDRFQTGPSGGQPLVHYHTDRSSCWIKTPRVFRIAGHVTDWTRGPEG